MRVEPYEVGSYMHVLKRGARGMSITNDDADRWRFIRSLYFLNDKYYDENWSRQRTKSNLFLRSDFAPPCDPLVEIICYTLMPNHVHLLLLEIEEGGVSKFMKKVGQSMTQHFNEKHGQIGSLFQGAYKSRTIGKDEYLRHVAMYIMVKNVFELYPKGGLKSAIKNFDSAWEWAIQYPFSSLGDYTGVRESSPIIKMDLLKEIWKTPKEFKAYARDMIEGGDWEKVIYE